MEGFASVQPMDFRAIDVLVDAPAMSPEETCGSVFIQMTELPDRPCVAVIDTEGRVIGAVDRATLMQAFGHQFGRSVYERRPIQRLMNPDCMVIDADLGIDEITERIAMENPQALNTGFVITRNGRYLGIGLPILLMARAAEQARHRSFELAEANEAAEQANRAKSAFLATMSHEIRTPLNGVVGNLELLRCTEVSPDQAELIDGAELAAQTLLHIVGDVLDFAKVEAGVIELERIPMSPGGLLRETVALLTPQASNRNLLLEAHVGPHVPERIDGDPYRLRQVLMNLVGNAMKFTETGGVRIYLSRIGGQTAELEESLPDSLLFEVVDTGIGFDPKRAEALFDAFAQEDSSTTRRYGGTGLGLAICKELVELMGGRIWATARPSLGACFRFRIPLAAERAAEPVPLPALEDAPVVVLDPAAIAGQAALALRAAGGDIVWVKDGNAAAQSIRNWQGDRSPAALVQAAQGTDAADIPPDVPISLDVPVRVLVSARWSDDLRHAGLRAGFTHVLAADRTDAIVAAVAEGLRPRQETGAAPSLDLSAERSAMAQFAALGPVMVIDDTEMNLTVASRQIRQLGLAAVTESDPAIALDRLEREGISAVLVDLSMPQMDGFTFARRRRDQEAATGSQRIPIIALTGDVVHGVEQRCREAGMDGYLAKPVTMRLLAENLHLWLSNIAARIEPASAGADPTPSPRSAETGEPDGRGARTEEGNRPRTSAPPVDVAALADLLGDDDPEMIASMLQLFVTSTHQLRARLTEAVPAHDALAVKNTAHAAKSAARNAAANELGDVLNSLELEAASDRPDWNRITRLAQRAENRFAAIQMFVEKVGA